MASLIISMSVGGSIGTILGFLKDPLMNKVLAFSLEKLSCLAKGDHLSEEEKDFIKKYNSRQLIVNGHEYTEQFRVLNISRGNR